jgi:CubicO group peptidase (beta-lactamase class C family)
MQSGVIYNDDSHAYRAAIGNEPLDGSETARTMHELLATVEADIDEKKGFNYTSVNTDLLGWAIERATNRKLVDLVQELLWQPLRAENDMLMAVDSEGSPRAAGGACLTVRDLARLGRLLTDPDQKIVPTSWINEIISGGDKVVWRAGAWAPAFGKMYGDVAYHNCWVGDGEQKVMIALGVFGQSLMVDLKREVVVAKTASQAISADFGRLAMGVAAFREMGRVVSK